MHLYRFLREESPAFTLQVVILTCVSGVLQGFLVSVLINAAGTAAPHELNFDLFLFFAVTIAAFLWSRKYTLDQTAQVAEEVIERVRLRLADKVRRSELVAMESQGIGRLYASLTTDTQAISQAAGSLVNAAASSVMVVAALLYVLVLSPLIFFLALAFFAFVYYYFVIRRGETERKLVQAAEIEKDYFESLDDLIRGLKELKQSDRRSAEFFEGRLTRLSEAALGVRTDVARTLNRGLVMGQGLFFALLGAIVFIVPNLAAGEVPQIVPATAMVVFMIGPLAEVIGSIQILSKGSIAIHRLRELEGMLDAQMDREADVTAVPGDAFGGVAEIRCEGLTFSYPTPDGSENGFKLGPMDFTVQRGEIVFIVGGNGSGKSTFMRLLVGLYPPREGRILVNGQPLAPQLRQNYRNLFGTIFTDFHLFDEMYGIDAPTPEEATALLREMGLVEKTTIEGRRLTNRRLSTGQRKRLAMIIARLEDRPVLVFDEWAADQDPEFREFFYTTLLPRFRAAGKTLIIVSHDDRYFHCADRCLKMEFGHFIPFPEGPAS